MIRHLKSGEPSVMEGSPDSQLTSIDDSYLKIASHYNKSNPEARDWPSAG